MKRTLIVVLIALTVALAGCGGPGDAPEDNNTTGDGPGEDPGGGAEPGGDGGGAGPGGDGGGAGPGGGAQPTLPTGAAIG